MSRESQVENCNGFRFCKDCGKLCIPLNASKQEQNVMIYNCSSCGERRSVITFKGVRDDHVIKKTQLLQSEAADIKNRALGQDPSMPRKQMYCRNCKQEQEVVYYYKAGIEEKNIVIQYICKECGFSWTSDELAKWKKEGTDRDNLPAGFKIEDEEQHIEEDYDEDQEYVEGQEDGGNKEQGSVDDIFDQSKDEDELFAEDEEIQDE